jgi:NAD(P)-dependent dehydrogenase (short-subunit alcohol dehydrogenase family)
MVLFSHLASVNALVVGANGGIGLGFVQALLKLDHVLSVVAFYRQTDTSQALLALQTEYPERLHCLAVDLTDEASLVAGINQMRPLTNRLHLVINCVGVLHDHLVQPEKSLQQINAAQLTHYFQVNSMSAILLAKHLLPLLNHEEQSIFATLSAKIGSIGDNQLGGWYGYRASKAALNMLLKTASIEYARKSKNTSIVMLHPGTTDTGLSKPFSRSVPPDKLFSVERCVNQLLKVLESVTPKENGCFFSWDGTQLPW